MSNTVVITALTEVSVNGGASTDLGTAISSGQCLASEAFAALQVWQARSIAAAQNAATAAAQAAAGGALATANAAASAAQQTATTSQQSLSSLQAKVDQLVADGIAAGNDVMKLLAVLAEAIPLSTPGILAASQARLAAAQGAVAAEQALQASLTPTTLPPTPTPTPVPSS
jgi:hypothetical protein